MRASAHRQGVALAWDEIANFVATPYKDLDDVALLKMDADDFEQLEADQLMVQGMMGSRFLRTFERAVNDWNSTPSNENGGFLCLSSMQTMVSIEPNYSDGKY